MSVKQKVLFVVQEAHFFLTHRLPVAVAARDAGYDVHVATPDHPIHAATIRHMGFSFHPLSLSRLSMNPLREAETFIQMIRLLRRLTPDLIHLFTLKPCLYGGIAGRLCGVPVVVYTFAGLGHTFARGGSIPQRLMRHMICALLRVSLRHPRAFGIFQNPDDRQILIKMGIATARTSRVILGSGVDPDQFFPAPEPRGRVKILFASRLLSAKGVREFISAAKILKQRGVPADFLVAGRLETSHPDGLPLKYIRKWHDQGVIQWLGQIDDMATAYQRCHIACLPTYYPEGVPKTLIEAASCARPIVTTDTPGCREIVRHNWNGLCVPARDAVALADALAFLAKTPKTRRTFGKRGRHLILDKFTIALIQKKTLSLYAMLLSHSDLSGNLSHDEN